MPFSETKNLVDNDSKVRIDVESMARIEISDIEYLLQQIKYRSDSRLVRIMYEVVITKISTAFQLAIRACKYLEQEELRKEIIKSYPKDSKSGLGAIAHFRENLFHDGISFIEKTTFYPFGIVRGRGFVAIRVCLNATLTIKGLCKFEGTSAEHAITSEGVFEIQEPGTDAEKWVEVDAFPRVSATNYDDIEAVAKVSLEELRSLWGRLAAIRIAGDGKHEYAYLNEGGYWELLEKRDNKVTSLHFKEKSMRVEGDLTISPPRKIRICKGSLMYE